MIPGLLLTALAFLLGTIPFGLVLTRVAGLGDIRQLGSGSTGATNVLRTGRKDMAFLTLLLDMAKGALGVWLAARYAGPAAFSQAWAAVAAVAAVLGHCHSVWLRGRGGKGVATGFGVLLVLSWPAALLTGLVWLAVAVATRISSAGALAATTVAPVAMWGWAGPVPALAALLIALEVVWRHRANIARLRAGTEPRFGRRT